MSARQWNLYGLVLVAALATAGPSIAQGLFGGLFGRNNGELSEGLIAGLVKQQLANDDEEKCMNVAKIKSYRTNATLAEILLTNNSGRAGNPFPLVFSEEAFLPWKSDDQLVMYLLISGDFIAVHEGGYQRSMTTKGAPGAAYRPQNQSDLDTIFEAIRQMGAVVELTDAGAAQGVWDPEKGFCAAGSWNFVKLQGWTAPAADSTGVVVTHIRTSEKFVISRLGRATRGINPWDETFTRDGAFKAAKFNDGWRLVDGE